MKKRLVIGIANLLAICFLFVGCGKTPEDNPPVSGGTGNTDVEEVAIVDGAVNVYKVADLAFALSNSGVDKIVLHVDLDNVAVQLSSGTKTIDGNGFTINGNGIDPIFNVTGGSMIFIGDITFQNMVSASMLGGALDAYDTALQNHMFYSPVTIFQNNKFNYIIKTQGGNWNVDMTAWYRGSSCSGAVGNGEGVRMYVPDFDPNDWSGKSSPAGLHFVGLNGITILLEAYAK